MDITKEHCKVLCHDVFEETMAGDKEDNSLLL
jgi:hypothetical protein